MKRYANDAQRAVAIAKAETEITQFMKTQCSYTELMLMAAKSQAQVFNIINLISPDAREQLHVEELAEYFYYSIAAIELLEPFNEDQLYATL